MEECGKNVLLPVALGWVLSYLRDPDNSSMTYEMFIGCAVLICVLTGLHMFTNHIHSFNLARVGKSIALFTLGVGEFHFFCSHYSWK